MFMDRVRPAAQSKARLKIYGERNTGTNYLTELAALNFDVDILPGRVSDTDLPTRITRKLHRLAPKMTSGLHEAARDRYFEASFARNLGWKHMNPQIDRIGPEALAGVRFLMVVKNPYAWVLSLYRKPYHASPGNVSLEAFLERPLRVMKRRENVGPRALLPLELWSRKMHGYLALQQAARHAMIMKYEDFLADEAGSLNRLATGLDLPRLSQFQRIEYGVKDADRHVPQSEYADYYLRERWRAKLSAAALQRINDQLDPAVMTQLGYALIDPATG